MEIVPILDLVPGTDFDLNGAIGMGLRSFYFSIHRLQSDDVILELYSRVFSVNL
jgi:hypothetical protein